MISSNKHNTNASTIKISCVLNGHREGRLAWRSIRSLRAATDAASDNNITCEIIAVLDRPNAATRQIFNQALAMQMIDVLMEVDFGDPGLSRNAAIARAQGDYIANLDADDLMSANWLAESYKYAEAHQDQTLVVHPKWNLYFGTSAHIYTHIDQRHAEFQVGNLLRMNYWTALMFTRRQLLLEVPYRAALPDSGFGYEDWHWNCEAIAKGALHVALPDTVHFIRLKEQGSVNKQHTNQRAVIAPTSLFSAPNWLKVTASSQQSTTQKGDLSPYSSRAYRARKKARHYFITSAGLWKAAISYSLSRLAYHLLPVSCRPFLRLVRDTGRRILKRSGQPAAMSKKLLPTSETDFLRGATASAARIEPSLAMLVQQIGELPVITLPGDYEGANAYKLLLRDWPTATTHVFFAPWIKRGGADLGLLHHLRALDADPAAKVVLITTENADSPWLDQVPESVHTIEFGRVFSQLTESEQQTVILRMLLQHPPAVVHNINSRLCWDLFVLHGRALSQQSRLYASCFCDDYDTAGNSVGYARSHLDKAYDQLTCILSDNAKFPAQLCADYAFDLKRFETVYFPTAPRMPMQRSVTNRQSICWAGRLDTQKRPDILIKIAQSLPGVLFDVYGSVLLDQKNGYANQLAKLPNVRLMGAYNGFESIPVEQYSALLYTSAWDGLPNVLLEAGAAGLPIIAPDIGGIAELIDEECGYLVAACDDVVGYVSLLSELLAAPEIAAAKAKQLHEKIDNRHSFAAFTRRLREIEGYLPKHTLARSREVDLSSDVIL